MSTEMLIIVMLGAFIAIGVFYSNDSSPRSAFLDAGPTLGLRLERNLETGAGFTDKSRETGNIENRVNGVRKCPPAGERFFFIRPNVYLPKL